MVVVRDRACWDGSEERARKSSSHAEQEIVGSGQFAASNNAQLDRDDLACGLVAACWPCIDPSSSDIKALTSLSNQKAMRRNNACVGETRSHLIARK